MCPDEIPKGDSFDFVLIPAEDHMEPIEEEDTEGATKGASNVVKEDENNGIIVYCMDVSASMSMEVSLPDIQGNIS